MSLLVTGSIGIDTIQTPHGQADDVLGGSAVYFSIAASMFYPVRLVGAVGEDFPDAYRHAFDGRPIDLAGLEVRKGSKTFRWHGKYEGDMNAAQTLRTDLNVLGEAGPKIPEQFRDSRFVFLANTHPALQRELLAQLRGPQLVVCDTMNLWIETAHDELVKTLGKVNGIVMNDGEVRLFTEKTNLVDAGRAILSYGPQFVIIKKGEHGSLVIDREGMFVLPGYPTSDVRDPTGAGDSFAGGLMGHIASVGRADAAALRAGVARGTVMASFTIEGFTLDGLKRANTDAVAKRLTALREMVNFK